MNHFKRSAIVLSLFFILAENNAFAQFTDTLSQIAKIVFYEKSVYKKIFIEHKDYVKGPSVLLLPNMPMTRKYPDLADRIGINNVVGKQSHSALFLSEEKGVVILTIPRYDSDHALFAGIHKFSYSATEALVELHTTSRYMVDSLANRYIKVTCWLKNKNGTWRIDKLKIEKNDCCKDFPHYSLEILDDRHYK